MTTKESLVATAATVAAMLNPVAWAILDSPEDLGPTAAWDPRDPLSADGPEWPWTIDPLDTPEAFVAAAMAVESLVEWAHEALELMRARAAEADPDSDHSRDLEDFTYVFVEARQLGGLACRHLRDAAKGTWNRATALWCVHEWMRRLRLACLGRFGEIDDDPGARG